MTIWFADTWQAPIPQEFSGIKFTKSGWFDRRRHASYYAAFRKWLDDMDAASRK
jgi:hypothetical protein